MLIAVFTFQPLRTTARPAWNLRGAIRCNLQRWDFFFFFFSFPLPRFHPISRALGLTTAAPSTETTRRQRLVTRGGYKKKKKDPTQIWSEWEMKQKAAMGGDSFGVGVSVTAGGWGACTWERRVHGKARVQVHERKTPSWRLDVLGINISYTHTRTQEEREKRANALRILSPLHHLRGGDKKQKNVITRAAATNRRVCWQCEVGGGAKGVTVLEAEVTKLVHLCWDGISFFFLGEQTILVSLIELVENGHNENSEMSLLFALGWQRHNAVMEILTVKIVWKKQRENI